MHRFHISDIANSAVVIAHAGKGDFFHNATERHLACVVDVTNGKARELSVGIEPVGQLIADVGTSDTEETREVDDALVDRQGYAVVEVARDHTEAEVVQAEGVIGQLENLNSDCPSFVMHSAKVWHFMTKKYISDHRHCVAGHVTVSGAISGDHNKLLVNIMLSQET
jgi:hypothetical protein